MAESRAAGGDIYTISEALVKAGFEVVSLSAGSTSELLLSCCASSKAPREWKQASHASSRNVFNTPPSHFCTCAPFAPPRNRLLKTARLAIRGGERAAAFAEAAGDGL